MFTLYGPNIGILLEHRAITVPVSVIPRSYQHSLVIIIVAYGNHAFLYDVNDLNRTKTFKFNPLISEEAIKM